MINPALFKKAAAVDTTAHRGWRIAPAQPNWSVASELNAMFIASVEFGDACVEYPIVFVNAGNDPQGNRQIAPVAVFGLREKENLYLEQGGTWRASYLPALLQAYPFGIARVDDTRVVVVVDEAWSGWSQSEGTALFNEDGQPSEHLTAVRDQLEKIEAEVQRTRLFGDALVKADLLTEMRFDATLPDGKTLTVDGFLAVDEKKFAALSDEKVLELHKSGALGLIHAHQISLRHMRRLVQWRQERAAASPSA
ncbi:MAG: SapC family protein [Rubrivivax sp.]|nr:SapC family protein [Rubrivivax sp.]